MSDEVIYEALIEVKRFEDKTPPWRQSAHDQLVCSSLFDMRLLVKFTAVCGPQLIKADEPRSIIYAAILHEVYFALS
jgi:hypothetical protein